MFISTRNIKGQNIKRKELVYATEWMSNLLMGSRLSSKIHIDYIFKPIKEKALCLDNDDAYYPRIFEITIQSKLSRDEILGVIAHELVHVKQFARRELTHLGSPNPKFKGSIFSSDIDYWDAPWEIEAYGREVGLVARYNQHLHDTPNLSKRLIY